MAVINYTETKLNRGYRVIAWDNFSDLDEGDWFDMIGFEFVSAHVVFNASALVLENHVSNEPSPSFSTSVPNDGYISNHPLNFTTASLSHKCRWISYKSPHTVNPSGTVSVKLLVKEI